MVRVLSYFLVAWLVVLAGCGFRLRSDAQLPFKEAWVQADGASRIGPLLRKALRAQGKLANEAHTATALHILVEKESHTKDILSLSGGGKVREYRLTYTATLNVTAGNAKDSADNTSTPLIEPIVLQQVRELTYSDTATLAKEAEEASTKRNMEEEALRQALRRLAYIKRP